LISIEGFAAADIGSSRLIGMPISPKQSSESNQRLYLRTDSVLEPFWNRCEFRVQGGLSIGLTANASVFPFSLRHSFHSAEPIFQSAKGRLSPMRIPLGARGGHAGVTAIALVLRYASVGCHY
jgi:hypothetical protein